ncbi:MAG: hypothetical protein J6B73_03790 [Methanobrevibacter sp.]|uniref:Uncharacterized protein n=1 Tax=Methanobrevibacter millerae TaxID=230361 RepID=A0A8T3VG33_9EURY|nr:hypothetical protein [Methanobrevibacter sp.]MBE6510062.1 hypothetical protein [Methanobrevibacter millerae]MBO5151278.1 hypothetical protein [Methanobrevibacter sp.]
MPIPGLDEYTIRSYINKFLLLLGIVIIIYAVLWILAELKIIPVIFFAIFPQIVLLLIGIFIVYIAISKRRQY